MREPAPSPDSHGDWSSPVRTHHIVNLVWAELFGVGIVDPPSRLRPGSLRSSATRDFGPHQFCTPNCWTSSLATSRQTATICGILNG